MCSLSRPFTLITSLIFLGVAFSTPISFSASTNFWCSRGVHTILCFFILSFPLSSLTIRSRACRHRNLRSCGRTGLVKKSSHPAVTALRTWAFVALSDISTTGKASFVATRMLSRSPSPSSHSEIATSMTAMSTVTFGLRSSSTAELLSLHSYTVSWNCLRMAEVEGTPTLSGSTTIKVVFRGSNCFTFLLLAIDAAFGIEPSASAPPLRLGIAGARSARWVALGLARRKILGDFCEFTSACVTFAEFESIRAVSFYSWCTCTTRGKLFYNVRI